MPAEQLGRSGGARLDSECQELSQGPQGASVAAGRRWRRTQEQRRAVRAALGAAMATEAGQRAEVLSVDEYRQLHSITLAVIGESQPPAGEHEPDDSEDEPPADGTERWQPVQRFADAPFHAKLLQELRHASFKPDPHPGAVLADCQRRARCCRHRQDGQRQDARLPLADLPPCAHTRGTDGGRQGRAFSLRHCPGAYSRACAADPRAGRAVRPQRRRDLHLCLRWRGCTATLAAPAVARWPAGAPH